MPAAHASVLHYNTSVLHSTSTIALLDKGHQVCRQPCIALPLLTMLVSANLSLSTEHIIYAVATTNANISDVQAEEGSSTSVQACSAVACLFAVQYAVGFVV